MKRWLIGAFVVGIAGCGGDGNPDLSPVSGTITMDGKPVAFKSIVFVPEPGTPGNGAGAETNQDGVYNLISVRPGAIVDAKGVPPGRYKVLVTEPMIPNGSVVQPEAKGDEPAPAVDLPSSRSKKKQPSMIPAKYTKAETTPLRIEVTAEGGVIPFELSAK